MLLLILGVALWWAAHLFKRIAPGPRAAMGNAGRGAVALALVASIVLMVLGYRAAEGTFFYGREPATVGINNLMVLLALYFTSPGPKKGALFYRMRHPMLFGFLLWALAHLLVNGDTESFVLFGGLGLWALVEMVVINRAEPGWVPPPKGSIAKDGMFFFASLILLLVIGYIHGLIGPTPFG
ncbi:NnrU family protein [Sagittula salina]|uniref:NnrU domain-containing protein n=1 Tax=Sagittula salina TaxID=2820268 RepID=A0A940MKW6_9RHOB|nr:NnrU family protein [Sagittula salina]MBP0481468.1 hypothetical protein [Sagittula salina]